MYNKEDEKLEKNNNREEQDSKEEVVRQRPKKKGKELEPSLDEKGKRERGKTIRVIIGPMGKLYNYTIYIRSLANCTTWFVEYASKMISLDNCTR